MGILSWLKGVTAGHDVGTASFAPGEEVFHGLNMKDAIDAHVAWKAKLEAQIGGNADKLEIGQVASDDRCVLGNWIHDHGKQHFGTLPEFADLMRDHAQFHLTAGKILMEVHDGKAEDAHRMLHGNEFRHASDMVQLSLVRLYARVKNP